MVNPHIIILALAFLVGTYMYFKKEIREMELEFQHGRFKSYDKFGRVVYTKLDDEEDDDMDEEDEDDDEDDDEHTLNQDGIIKQMKDKRKRNNYKSCNGYGRY